MKMHFITSKKVVPLALAITLLLSLSACNSGKDQVTEFKIRHDRVGTEMSFNLPGSEEDWDVVDHHFGTTSEDISYYPIGDDLDGTNSWSVQAQQRPKIRFIRKLSSTGKIPWTKTRAWWNPIRACDG